MIVFGEPYSVKAVPLILFDWLRKFRIVLFRAYYLNVYGRPLASAVPFFIATWLIRDVVRPATLPSFFAWAGLSVVTYLVPLWLVVLSQSERTHVLRVVGLAPRQALAGS